MSKLRILANNTILSPNASASGSIPSHQRVEHGAVTGAFTVGEVVAGSISGNRGGIIAGVGIGYIDIALLGDIEAANFYTPNAANTVPEVLTTAGGSATTTNGYRIPLSHPDFPPSNLVSPNRNLITPAKGYFQLDERNFKHIKITSTFVTPEPISVISILNHNFSDTAVITIEISSTTNLLYTNTITNPNQDRFAAGTDYYIKNGQKFLTDSDRRGSYKNSNIFMLYLGLTVTATTISIKVSDPNSLEPFSYIGNVYAGLYYEVDTNMRDAWAISTVDTSTTVYAISPYSIQRPKYHVLQLSFSLVSSNERAFWHNLFLQKGIHTDFIIDLFANDPDVNANMFSFYGRFNTPQLGFTNDFGSRYSLQLEFRESI